MSGPRHGATLLALLLLLTAQAARADRLHLDGGGTIDVERWWVEDDWIHYDSAAGTISMPRSMVIRIEGIESSSPDPSPPAGAAGPASRAPRPGELRELLLAGKAAIEARDYSGASSRFREAVAASPDSVAARVGYAISEVALGHDGSALAVVLDGLARTPENPRLLELLGDLRWREERVDDALEAWRRAFAIEPSDSLRERILKGEREQQASRHYSFSTTSHFNVRYDGKVDSELAGAAMDYLEQQYWKLAGRYGHSPPQPITVLLYPTREFRDVTRAPEWVGGLYDGKIRVPLGGLNKLHAGAQDVLVHELTHAVLHSKTKGNCPRWLHEGLAQLEEDKPLRRADQQRLAQAVDPDDPAAWTLANFSYPLALSQIRYLESRRGFSGIVHLLELLGDGLELDDALRRTYGEDYAAICRRWLSTIREEPGR